ncbi:MAG: NAD-dependent protein deacylase [Oscillospiraceae bacterium]|nr:NAD-dependent protein deacylase [Oscillospiraceae bacterium]
MDDFEKKIEELALYIAGSDNIVFFGGAGVSTESGIPDFRSSSGIYSDSGDEYGAPPEVMLSNTYFFDQTESFYKFYKTKMLYLDAEPNQAHKTLAKLEKLGKLSAVVTQNIDGLHQKAGSKNVVELHGSVADNFCLKCKKKFDVAYVVSSSGVPRCDNCGGIVKPKVTLYEERLDYETVRCAIDYITRANMLIVGGTSLSVYPAAHFASRFFAENKNPGKKSAIINKTETSYDKMFDICFQNSIGEVLVKACAALF